jgi:hypothetical protein
VNLFEANELRFANVLYMTTGFDKSDRWKRPILWGRLVATGRDAEGNATYAFPFCLEGQCTDPDEAAPNFGVVRQDKSSSRPFAWLVLSVRTDAGSRYCRSFSGKYDLPVCYNENATYPVTRSSLTGAARALLPRYDRIAAVYEATHPPEPGSLRDLADHSECRFVLVETVEGNRVVDYSNRLVCEYKPKR